MYDLVKREGRIGTVIDRASRSGASSVVAAESNQLATADTQEDISDPLVIQSAAVTLDPGTSTSVTFPVDTASVLSTLLEAETTEGLSYTLRAPSGTFYVPDPSGLSIQNPEVGTWTATLTVTDNAPQAIHLTFAAVVDSNMTLSESAAPFYVRRGETGTFSITVQDSGAPMTDLSITGTLTSPTGSTNSVSLPEDTNNPGTYNLSYLASEIGTYSLDVQIMGTRFDGTLFRRETAIVATSVSGTMIDPEGAAVVWDSADMNTDGLTDVLSATLQIQVPDAGTYNLEGSLGTPAAPSQFGASQLLELIPGTNMVTLTFDGEDLGRILTANAYMLQQVHLSGSNGQLLDWREHIDNAYFVDPRLFQHRLLDGLVASATPVDTNGDNRSDVLTFTSVITTTRAGNYKLQATLADNNHQPFAFAEQGLLLAQGGNTVQISFDGTAIAANGVSGSFTLSDLVVTPLDTETGNQGLHLLNSFETEPLNISEFAQHVVLSVSTNMASTAGYVQMTPASPDGKYIQGTQVELRPVFLTSPPISWSWSVDGGPEISDPTLSITMDTDHAIRLTATFPPSETPTGTITPDNGGVVTTNDGSFQIEFPPNAVTSTTIVTYTNMDVLPHPLPPSSRVVRKFTLEARTSQGDQVTQFQQPYTMQLSYTDAQLSALDVPEESLNLTYWDGNAWSPMLPCEACDLDIVNNRITVIANHFTDFALLGFVEPEQQKVFFPLVKD